MPGELADPPQLLTRARQAADNLTSNASQVGLMDGVLTPGQGQQCDSHSAHQGDRHFFLLFGT
jgi:hypothetical protein